MSQDQSLSTAVPPSVGTVAEPGSALERKARLARAQLRASARLGQVVLIADDTGTRHVVRLLGKIDGVSLIVSNPVEDGKLLFVAEGRGYTVRVFDGRELSRFHATVLKAPTQPQPHLHLSMPSQEAQRLRVRSDYSAGIVLRAVIRYDAAAHFANQLDALAIELAGSGAVCVAACVLPADESRVRLLIELPLAERPRLDVEASIAAREPVEIDGAPAEVLTLEFERLSELSRYRLRTYVAETLLAETLAQRPRR